MKNSFWPQNLMRATTWLMAAATPWVIGCVKGGNISSSSSSNNTTGSLVISKVYPTAQGESWTPIKDGAGMYYIKGLDLTITGTCSRGVNSIKAADQSGNYTETASCDVNGNFVFNKTYSSGAQGDKTPITLTAYDVTDTAISGATATVTARIDATAPTAPVVTTPASTPYTANAASATFAVSGSCSADTVKLTFNSPTGPEILPSGTTWTYNVTLVQGASTIYQFYAHDLAGNVSAVTNQTILWAPTITPRVTNFGAGALVTDAGSGFKIEGSLFAYPGTAAIASGSGFKLETGFNIITNSVRAY